MEMTWELQRYIGFMTKSVLNKIERLERAIISAYKLPHKLMMFHSIESGKPVVDIPVILTEDGHKSISSLVPIQNWKWYSEDYYKFIKFCEDAEIDIVNLNAKTTGRGYEVARVSATSLEEYIESRDKSTRKTLKRVYEREYPQLVWETATSGHEELLKYMIKKHIAYWSSKDDIDFSEIAEISAELYSELALGEHGYCRIGYLNGVAVCAYIWVGFEGVWQSVMALRDREVPLQLGHCMQIDKVIQSVDLGTFCLGRSNDFPHKKRWATEIGYLGAVGEGYK